MIVLIVMKWSINWQERMLSATCLEFGGDTWGADNNPGTDLEWVDACDDGWCTPAGVDCSNSIQAGGDEQVTTATMCPLDMGGSGDGCQPPNLITTLINIALMPGTVDEPMYSGQPGIQNLLLLIAFVSVPILLFAKPYLLSKQHEAHAEEERNSHSSDAPLAAGGGDDHGGDEHGFGEILIHQAIETVSATLTQNPNLASDAHSLLSLRLPSSSRSLAYRSSLSSAWCPTPRPTCASGPCPSPTPNWPASSGRRRC